MTFCGSDSGKPTAPSSSTLWNLSPLWPSIGAWGELVLGEGESIQDGTYAFVADYDHPGSNYHRPMDSFTAGFNSNRWNFGAGSQVTYRFRVPGCRWTEAGLGFNLNYHTRGGCVIEASRDGRTWKELATQSSVGAAVVERLPSDLLPAAELLVRLRPTKCRQFISDRSRRIPGKTGSTAGRHAR